MLSISTCATKAKVGESNKGGKPSGFKGREGRGREGRGRAR